MMRIRYNKKDGSGREVDMDDGAARRVIASGAAEAVETEGELMASAEDDGRAQPAARKVAAKKTARRSR